MRARGPDGHGLWLGNSERVALAHRRLSIIELSEAGAQPMASADGRLQIVFNGEIYNYRALRNGLQAENVSFASHSDTEVLLALYARHGAAMLPMLRGMFALAIWDARDGSLFIARDPYGIKPLYYANERGQFSFASQVKALLADSSISRDASPAGIVGFHLFGSVPEPFTLYRAIRALPAGCHMRVDTRGPGEPVQWASIAATLAERRPSDVEPRAALLDSVRHHLVADVEVGAFLSGGVDSTALIGLMRDCGQDRIKACTLEFEEFAGTPRDETPLARRLAAQYGVEHRVHTVTAAEFAADLPRVIEAMDQPSVDGVNSWFVSKAVRAMGLKVALSGLGGDELLGGYSTFRTIPRTRRLAGPVAGLPFAGPLARGLIGRLAPDYARKNPKALGVLDLAGSWGGTYLLRRAVLLPSELGDVMDEGVAREGLAELDPVRRIGATIMPDPGDDIARVGALEASNYMRNQLLRDTDWASMAHSLEVRVPLVDHHLLKQIAPIVPTLKGDAGKRLLASAPLEPVPLDVVTRPKTGFGVPMGQWLGGRQLGERLDSRRWSSVVLERYQEGNARPLAA